MRTGTFLLCWIITFIVMFSLNGVFHELLAANFFDEQLSFFVSLIHPMSEVNPLWVGALDLILTFGMTYFITQLPSPVSKTRAAFAGALLNLISSVTWNFANAAVFVGWPTAILPVDISWHFLLGSVGGLLIAVLYNRFSRTAVKLA